VHRRDDRGEWDYGFVTAVRVRECPTPLAVLSASKMAGLPFPTCVHLELAWIKYIELANHKHTGVHPVHSVGADDRPEAAGAQAASEAGSGALPLRRGSCGTGRPHHDDGRSVAEVTEVTELNAGKSECARCAEPVAVEALALAAGWKKGLSITGQ
jgi:hypothetical protein